METLITAIAVIVLVLAGVIAVRSYAKRLASGCCGGGGQKSDRKVRVADRNKAHYPYSAVLDIDGMVCAACARRVENGLNRLDGVWATVDLGKKQAAVRMKTPYPEAELRRAVRESGYTMLRMRREQSS